MIQKLKEKFRCTSQLRSLKAKSLARIAIGTEAGDLNEFRQQLPSHTHIMPPLSNRPLMHRRHPRSARRNCPSSAKETQKRVLTDTVSEVSVRLLPMAHAVDLIQIAAPAAVEFRALPFGPGGSGLCIRSVRWTGLLRILHIPNANCGRSWRLISCRIQ